MFKVENPGEGDCAFYSMMIGLIPILQMEIKTGQYAILPKILKEIEGFERENFKEFIRTFKLNTRAEKNLGLVELQQALRRILVKRRINSIKEYELTLQKIGTDVEEKRARGKWQNSDKLSQSCWLSYNEENQAWRFVYQRNNGDIVFLERENNDSWNLAVTKKDDNETIQEKYIGKTWQNIAAEEAPITGYTETARELVENVEDFLKGKTYEDVSDENNRRVLFGLIQDKVRFDCPRQLMIFTEVVAVFKKELGLPIASGETNNDFNRDKEFKKVVGQSVQACKLTYGKFRLMAGAKYLEDFINDWVKLNFFDNLTIEAETFYRDKESPVMAVLKKKLNDHEWGTENDLRELAEELDVQLIIYRNGGKSLGENPDSRPTVIVNNNNNRHWQTYFDARSLEYVSMQLDSMTLSHDNLKKKLENSDKKNVTAEAIYLLSDVGLLDQDWLNALCEQSENDLAGIIMKLSQSKIFFTREIMQLLLDKKEQACEIFSCIQISVSFTVFHFLYDANIYFWSECLRELKTPMLHSILDDLFLAKDGLTKAGYKEENYTAFLAPFNPVFIKGHQKNSSKTDQNKYAGASQSRSHRFWSGVAEWLFDIPAEYTRGPFFGHPKPPPKQEEDNQKVPNNKRMF